MDLLQTFRRNMSSSVAISSESTNSMQDDLQFVLGSPDNQWQWPSDVINTRIGAEAVGPRPCLTINKMPQHVRQITNDMRQNRPSGKVIPVDDNADVEMAEILDGLIRHIEYISDADTAYDTACENQVIMGLGYWRLYTEYCDSNSFDQEIKIGRIANTFSVYMDPGIQDPCGQDANWCAITEELTKDEYERMFPNAKSYMGLQDLASGDVTMLSWMGNDTVKIAEYFWVEEKTKILNQYINGAVAFKGTPEDKKYRSMLGEPVRSRESNQRVVKWVKTNGYEILESEKVWPGKYIPVIRVVGSENEVNGKRVISGIVRMAKDAQRMFNYWTSAQAEMLALAPKAPFIAAAGQLEGFERQWSTANIYPWSTLEYNAKTDATGEAILPPPQRSMPPMSQPGLIEARMGAADDIKGTTGQYDSSLGATSNERSGKAIIARERQSDVGTYHFVDNFARAIRYTTRQIIDLFPKIYDTERIARIVGEDGKVDKIAIDPMQQQAVVKQTDEDGNVIKKIFNPGIGKYDVMVTTGPSYLTKRQEAVESMSNILQANPQLWQVAGDLFVKNMDWPGAQELSKRLAKTIDPKLIADDDKSPQLQAAEQQIEQMGQQMQAMQQMLQNVHNSIEAQEVKIKEYDAETKRISALQSGMNEEQIQELVMGTLHAAIDSGDVVGQTPFQQQEMPNESE